MNGGRRQFLKSGLVGGVSLCSLQWNKSWAAATDATGPPEFTLGLDTAAKLFDGKTCWCHPRAGIVPGVGHDGNPRVEMTMNTLQLEGSDVFKAMFALHTDDLGKTWTQPREQQPLATRTITLNGEQRPVAVSDFWPTWHAASNTLLGTGHTVVYTPDWKVTRPRPRHTAYSTYDPKAEAWTAWQTLDMPGDKFYDAGAGCAQRVDLEDGTILLPIYFHPPEKNSHVTVARCSFDGKTLKFLEQGNELHIDDKTRGLHEPSLARFAGKFFLTLRNDKLGFVAQSNDGLNFEPMRPWAFDDGSDLGNYNTQQHWVTHSDALFLVYTRRGANNDHVFRHRAPLFMAQVDPEKLCVIRDTEQVLVPERGARLGNFGVTTVKENETWVTVSEWMQPKGVEKYGSDGSVFVARIHWKTPNKGAV